MQNAADAHFTDTVDNVKDAELSAQQSAGNIVDTVRQTSYNTERSLSQTREQLINGFASAQLSSCAGFSDVQKQVSDCCCEIKGVVAEEARHLYVLTTNLALKYGVFRHQSSS